MIDLCFPTIFKAEFRALKPLINLPYPWDLQKKHIREKTAKEILPQIKRR